MHVRVTGVVIEDDRILLLKQDTDAGRSWSLLGGKVATARFPGAGSYMGAKSSIGL